MGFAAFGLQNTKFSEDRSVKEQIRKWQASPGSRIPIHVRVASDSPLPEGTRTLSRPLGLKCPDEPLGYFSCFARWPYRLALRRLQRGCPRAMHSLVHDSRQPQRTQTAQDRQTHPNTPAGPPSRRRQNEASANPHADFYRWNTPRPQNGGAGQLKMFIFVACALSPYRAVVTADSVSVPLQVRAHGEIGSTHNHQEVCQPTTL